MCFHALMHVGTLANMRLCLYVCICVCMHMHTYLCVLPFHHGESSLVQLELLLSEPSCHFCSLIILSFVQNGLSFFFPSLWK